MELIKDDKILIKKVQTHEQGSWIYDWAFNYLVDKYKKFIWAYACKFGHDFNAWDENKSFAMSGFKRAVELYDLNSDIKLTTYASYWMLQAIQRGYAKWTKVIDLPIEVVKLATKSIDFIDNFRIEHGFKPSYEFVAKSIGSSEEKVRQAIESYRPVLSIDKKVGNDSDSISFEDNISGGVDPHDIVVKNDKLKTLKEFLSKVLNTTELYIILHTHGVFGKDKLKQEKLHQTLVCQC